MSLVEQTCRVVIIPESTSSFSGTPETFRACIDFSGREGQHCGQPFFAYIYGEVPTCKEHFIMYEGFAGKNTSASVLIVEKTT
jgi:hypothetical protein